ncbi:MAG TPA: hemolysin family protein [Candidatus Kapabacteria bacterium]|nr:hemolysin family protein [Candidatus Kapabacteria bacterium]
MDIVSGLLLVALFIALNGFFVAAEFAIVKVRGSRLSELATHGDSRVEGLEQIISHLDSYLAATQVGITLVSLALGWIGEPVITSIVAPVFKLFAPNSEYPHVASAVVGFALLTSMHIIFGELLPKSIAITYDKRVALSVTRPLRLFHTIFRIPIRGLNLAFRAVAKLVGLPNLMTADEQTEEELRHAILDSAKRGVVTESESEMIESVFEFGETMTKEIMVHRSDVVGIDIDGEPRDIFRIIETEGFSRLPVYRSSLDEVLGILYVKDLLPSFSQLERLTIPSQNAADEFVKLVERVMRPPKFVSETQLVSEVLRDFRRSRTHIGIVVSEHGGVEGIVTMEDILEELVGEIEDESDQPADEQNIIEIGSAIYIDPSMNVEDFNERFAERFEPIEVNPDYQTISGYIQKESGKIPNVGDVIEAGALRFTVKRKLRHRLEQVKIEVAEPPGFRAGGESPSEPHH